MVPPTRPARHPSRLWNVLRPPGVSGCVGVGYLVPLRLCGLRRGHHGPGGGRAPWGAGGAAQGHRVTPSAPRCPRPRIKDTPGAREQMEGWGLQKEPQGAGGSVWHRGPRAGVGAEGTGGGRVGEGPQQACGTGCPGAVLSSGLQPPRPVPPGRQRGPPPTAWHTGRGGPRVWSARCWAPRAHRRGDLGAGRERGAGAGSSPAADAGRGYLTP